MSNLEKMDQSTKEYFHSLPASVQEQILQSGVTLTTKEELQTCYENLLKKNS